MVFVKMASLPHEEENLDALAVAQEPNLDIIGDRIDTSWSV